MTGMRPTAVLVVVLAIGLAALVAGAGVGMQATAVGPYVQNVGTDNATICWATLAGSVSLIPAEEEHGTINRYEHHEVVLRDLEPGTRYTYTVMVGGRELGKATFTTVPEGEHPFSFAVIGDTQNTDSSTHPALVKQIMAARPDLVLNTGDLVSDGREMGDWDNFFRINSELMRTTPYYPSLGNHERRADLYFEIFALPGNEAYYSFDRGAAHFIALDTPGAREPETNQPLTEEERERLSQAWEESWQRQMAWLKEDLEASRGAKYVFVYFHYPPYSVLASRTRGLNAFRERYGTIFQDYQVSAVFTGHDHHYHRAVAGGVQFVTQGAAGGKARPTDAAPLPESVKWGAIETYVNVKVGPEAALVQVFDPAGQVVDSFELKPRHSQ